MVEAIRFVLERRGFRAGRYSVGYQSCDESTAQAHGFEFNRCYSNAKAFARNPNVIGVIGAHSSFCSYYQIPIANQAPGGPLAMISPSNSFTGLTRPHRGMSRGELAALYPSGVRNYVRLAAADHLQAVASAELARQLGTRRLFVLSYGDDPYLAGWADNVRRVARNLGIEIAGSRPWNPDARSFARLARRISRAGADAVFIGGHLLPNGGALVRDSVPSSARKSI
jgi:branched-chain amino acid transport system substrate-binding protein